MKLWQRILRGIDVWIEKQLDKAEQKNKQPHGSSWHPPHMVIHDVLVNEQKEKNTNTQMRKKKYTRNIKPFAQKTFSSLDKQLISFIKGLFTIISTPFIVLKDKLFGDIIKNKHLSRKQKIRKFIMTSGLIAGGGVLLLGGFLLVYVAGLKIPTFDEFIDRDVSSSTKIYDRTGEILLFDIHQNVSRTVISLEEMSPFIIDALISIEDDQFYSHNGVDIKATFRAILYTGLSKLGLRGGGTQGGSTLTQQVLKNTLLTSERTFKRKMKEWFLAYRLEKVLTKHEILENYLNEAPYGGSMYGVETASQAFFGKSASEVTIAESAYLAAIPNAPTFFSPYGNNIDALENRKNTVLRKMREFNTITQEQYEEALAEEVEFRPRSESFAKALHFVEYVREILNEEYGQDVVEEGGLRVITTLNYELQKEAEEIVAERALQNEEDWGASNMALVAIDPTNGDILTMVGSRGYSDPDIDGKFNVATAQRQPGSSFKPFIYARAIEEGYTDQTILFDTQTQFAGHCTLSDGTNQSKGCYRPGNYDGLFKGPLTIRQALAQSRNIPAVKAFYLVGLRDALNTAQALGINTLRDPEFYGLTLVLGGGEVTLLDMTSAYGVFGNDGVRFPHNPILEIYDNENELIFENSKRGQRVLSEEAARTISSILSDNEARAPLFGFNSFLNFGGSYDVAGKTGTTNSNRDAWLVGYSPTVAVGVWSGNNDNTPMRKGSSISGPAWRDFMNEALNIQPKKRFIPPLPTQTDIKPVLRGIWQGNNTIVVDTISGKLATEFTPEQTREEIIIPEAHTILHWVNKNDPRGPIPNNPQQDSQYKNWEESVQLWLQKNQIDSSDLNIEHLANLLDLLGSGEELPTDDVHIPENFPTILSVEASNNTLDPNQDAFISLDISSRYPLQYTEYYLDDIYIGQSEFNPLLFSFTPSETEGYVEHRSDYTLRVVVTDEVFNTAETSIDITIQ